MSLNDFDFKSSYNKIDHDIANDFYLPCMKNSVEYDRITGYFSSSIYSIAWASLKDFISNKGFIRLICSPYLSEEDCSAISRGNAAQTDAILKNALEQELLCLMEKEYVSKPATLLACLIANGTISIKIAVPLSNLHPTIKLLFHDKVGIFRDSQGNCVGFRGSLNETYSGLSNEGNVESIDVFQSWDGGKETTRTLEAVDYFERVWNGETESVLVEELPDEIKNKLKLISKGEEWEKLLDEVNAAILKEKKWTSQKQVGGVTKSLRPHQAAALESWENHGYKGILEHATGSGKTFTAICAIRNALKRKKAVLVLVPSVGLLEQWQRELKTEITDLDVDYLICGGNHSTWKKNDILKIWLISGANRNTIVLSTMDTACGQFFLSQIANINNLLLVVDEVHRIGSPKRSKALCIDASDRLGLSATPRRFGDIVGTKLIMDYFGGVLSPVYSLQDAIRDGVLTKYFYYPVTIYLSPLEQDKWNSITVRINRLYAQIMSKQSNLDSCLSEPRMKKLMLERARIVKNAEGKVSMAASIVAHNYEKGQKWIVYCDNQTQLTNVLNELLRLNIDAYEYHSEMVGDRSATIDYYLSYGGVLVSIRCLDEGIDLPATTHALIIASSKNPREFIQRRGRILRKAKGKFFSYLYDIIVAPNGEIKDDTRSNSIIESELARAIQFGEWAENPSCIAKLKNIAIDYEIDIQKSSIEGVEE